MNKELIITAKEKGYFVDENGNVLNKKGVKRKLNINNRGYYYFSIRINKNVRSVLVHRLKGYQLFKDSLFEENKEIRHLDNNPLNNSSNNLKLGTHSQNMMDMEKEKRRLNASNPKYNHLKVIKDKKNGLSYSKIMKKYNIKSKATVSFIVNKSLANEKYI